MQDDWVDGQKCQLLISCNVPTQHFRIKGVDHGLRRRSGNVDCDGDDGCASKGPPTPRDGGQKS